ncbi:hypothetical protein J2X77_001786 [Sphingobacterium sp. 2149]|nr:hypothetical protein [Sphingobacterium sp. 2149]
MNNQTVEKLRDMRSFLWHTFSIRVPEAVQ